MLDYINIKFLTYNSKFSLSSDILFFNLQFTLENREKFFFLKKFRVLRQWEDLTYDFVLLPVFYRRAKQTSSAVCVCTPCIFILKDKNKTTRRKEMTSLTTIVLTTWHIQNNSSIRLVLSTGNQL